MILELFGIWCFSFSHLGIKFLSIDYDNEEVEYGRCFFSIWKLDDEWGIDFFWRIFIFKKPEPNTPY